MITIPSLILVLLVGFIIWYRGTSKQEDITKAQIYIQYGADKFKEVFGEEELKKIQRNK